MEIYETKGMERGFFKPYGKDYNSVIYVNIKDSYLYKKYLNRSLSNFGNDMKKAEILERTTINDILRPQKKWKINNEISGFVLPDSRGYERLDSKKRLISVEQKYNFLYQIKEILHQLHENGIIYGNLIPENVLLNGEKVLLDNIIDAQVGSLPFSKWHHYMRTYLSHGGRIDVNLDHFMLNIFTLYLLNDLTYDEILNCVELAFIQKSHFEDVIPMVGIGENIDCENICSYLLTPLQANDKFIIDALPSDKVKSLSL